MTSPFTLMRRYEKTMMVVVTGVAMVSFVLLGSVQNPQEIPPPLLVIFAAAVLGSIAWLAGLGRGKGTEWGLSGALVGAIIGLIVLMSSREASAVLTKNGNFTANDLSHLARQRSIANNFVQLAFQQSFGMGIPPQLQRQYLFGFGSGENVDTRDLVAGELLRREADSMGMVISNEVIMEFIKRLTSKPGLQESIQRASSQLDPQSRMYLAFMAAQMPEKPLTKEAFAKIRSQLRVSEAELLDALRAELKSVQAFELLYSRNELPPESFWEFYRQLNVRQSADVAVIPVTDFVSPDAKPSELELQDLFNQYRNNTPGFTPEGKPAEGRPGFLQPRRFQIGYFEAAYDRIEPLVGEVTDAEIQKRYEDRYLKNVPAESDSKENMDGPALPARPSGEPKLDAPKQSDKPADSKPEMKDAPKVEESKKEDAKKEAPAKDEKKDEPKPSDEKPEMKAAPKADEAKKDAAKKDAPVKESAKSETKPADEKKPEPAKKPEAEKPATDSKPTSGVMILPETQLVAFFDDAAAKVKDAAKPAEPAAEKPKEDKPAAEPAKKEEAKKEEPKAEKPAEKKSDDGKPAAEKADKPKDSVPADKKPVETAPAMPAPTGLELPPPPSPKSEVPVLDDALKAEIRQEILREKTAAEIQKRTSAAFDFLSDIAYRVQQDNTENGYLTNEQAAKELEKYAAEHHLVYVVTPLLSYEQLANSEDYPIGSAITTLGQRSTVAQFLYFSPPAALYRVGQADNFLTSSGYAFWKLADKAAYAPQSLDAEKELRDQVTEAWRKLQAQPKAKARAEELAKQIRESDKPMPEALAETTVTGQDGSLFVTIRSTGDFSWMNRPIVPPTSLQQNSSVVPSVVPGVDEPGADFFKTVFDEMQVGDVKVLPNKDQSAFYVIKILNRTPSTPEELEKFREDFIKSGLQPAYGSLAQRTLSEYSTDWFNDFFEEHEVVVMENVGTSIRGN